MSYERLYVLLWSNRTLNGRSNEKYLHTCAKSWHRRAAAEVGKAPIPKCTSNARAHANRDYGDYLGYFFWAEVVSKL
jgi:hypothetical protein